MIKVRPPTTRLQFVLQRTSEDLHEPDYAASAPIVRLTAYCDHERVFGWLHLHTERLTDLLNTHTELHLRDGEAEDVETGKTRAVEEVLIARRELIAVGVGQPRGDPALRRPTQTHPVAIHSGAYIVGGYLHVAPGADPLADFRGRPAMVPLTYAWIEHWSGEARSAQSTGTIVVNRDRADWMRLVTDEDLIGGQLRPVHRSRSG